MKNYPNQATTFERIRNTLQTIASLNARQANTLDDGILGYELAARKFYTFRGIDYATATPQDIQARIKLEKAKPGGNQGARTNARELRRTLIDFKWVDTEGVVTPLGQQLLGTQPGSPLERDLLADALIQLTITDTGNRTSSPVMIMLHLLFVDPSPHRAGLELMLEANDDSAGERFRVQELYKTFVIMPAAWRATRLHVTPFQLANATKVFPTLAKYAGLVTEDAQGTYHLAPSGMKAVAGHWTPVGSQGYQASTLPVPPPPAVPPVPTPPPGRRRTQRRITGGQERDANNVGSHGVNRTLPDGLTPDQQADAQNRLNERMDNHQDLVKYFASCILAGEGTFYEDNTSYDLVWKSNTSDVAHVFEMKTIDSDADAQVIRAVGQLHYYAHFNVAVRFKDNPKTKTIVVDGDLHDDLRGFLTAQSIGAIMAVEGQPLEALNSLGQEVLDQLPLNSVVLSQA
ncbi:hypothetical protein [Arthrobacter sp. EpRS71]|uniref:hypothetical protein n=1 Tax=Arthrobacter sp. EpRS71 TaxID=1743141 RepID=UPI000748E170|nr:hypothetical protein [Arthrobacter sp. EpRS71]KUM39002.1 hypothetical protein AR689_07560 [Arthrobacter sp. EpRS71]